MNKIKATLFIVIVSGFGLVVTQAQTTVSPAGGNASGIDGSVSYTIGQIDYLTNTGSNGIITEGVQQPWEILTVVQTRGITLNYSVYPNPTTDFVTLKIDGFQINNLSCQLFDSHGKLVREQKVEGSETNIQLGNLMAATYYLKVLDGKSVKIVYKLTINN